MIWKFLVQQCVFPNDQTKNQVSLVLEFEMSVPRIIKSIAEKKGQKIRTFEPFEIQRSNLHFQGWHKIFQTNFRGQDFKKKNKKKNDISN